MIGFTVKKSGRFVTNPKGVVRDIGAQLESDMRVASLLIRKALTAELSSKPKRSAFWGVMGGSPGLAVRTGRTRARLSPGGRVYRVGKEIIAAVGSPDQHVLDAEEGGTFTTSGFFRIPTAAAQTRAGVDRWAGMSIRNIPGAFLRRSKSGKLWAYWPKPDGDGVERLYLLVKSVNRAARHIFARVTKETRDDVVRQVGRGVALQVQRANQ